MELRRHSDAAPANDFRPNAGHAGDLKVNPGDSILARYDFNVKGATFPLQATFHFAQVLFTPRSRSSRRTPRSP